MQVIEILIVDDDPVTRTLLSRHLGKSEYRVALAENGKAALEMISRRYYDVILTDLMMPGGIDGIGVLEAAKTKNFNTEVILITAHGSIDNAITAMKKGACDYLQKPINFDELILRLDKIRNVRHLIKNACDLREAMDVTEQASRETIQNLELAVDNLSKRLETVRTILMRSDLACEDRIGIALRGLTCEPDKQVQPLIS